MLTEVVLIIMALVLYSVAIWSEKLKKQGLLLWMVIVFGLGFACDLVGTSSMVIKARSLDLNFHGACGYAALVIMGLHFLWALIAIIKHGQAQKLFSRYSVYAWFVWLGAFISGAVGSMSG